MHGLGEASLIADGRTPNSLVMFVRVGSRSNLENHAIASSADGGETWGAAQLLPGIIGPTCQGSIGSGGAAGRLLLSAPFSRDAGLGGRENMAVWALTLNTTAEPTTGGVLQAQMVARLYPCKAAYSGFIQTGPGRLNLFEGGATTRYASIMLADTSALLSPALATDDDDDDDDDAGAANAPQPPSTFVFNNPGGLILAGGASIQSAPLYSLRSGNPPHHTSAALRTVLNPGATVTRVTFSYRYNTGFGPTGVGTNFTLAVAGQPAYASPHLTDYAYSHNKSNYSLPVVVDALSLAIVVPKTVPSASYVEFLFDNNDRNVQLLLPITVTLECSGTVPCTPPPPPPPSHVLLFEHPPSIVAGPEIPRCTWPRKPSVRCVNGSGPWWQNIQALSNTHALGWAEQAIVATTDAGKTWDTPVFNDSAACELRGQQMCEAKTGYAIYPVSSGAPNCGGNRCGAFHTLGEQNETTGTKGNLTGLAAIASTRYFLDADGNFARELTGKAINITGFPHLRMLGGSGHYLRLADGSHIGISKSTLSKAASPSGRLSVVAIRSTDGGYNWTFASVVASAEEVPEASEGPSEGALALLKNGTLMAVMRVDGQSGHYLPYISKLSDDGGKSWHSLRFLRGGGSGGTAGAGCVKPALLSLNNSLVLAGGRPSPLSRDVRVWLNAAGDGDQWFGYSISYWHNRLNTKANWMFPQGATNNSRSFPRLTTSYTSIVRTGNDTGYVLYGMGIRAFTMAFRLVVNPAAAER